MKKVLMICALFFFTFHVHAVALCPNNSTAPATLDSVYKKGKFRIYYSTNSSSVDNLPDQTDQNQNAIPDYVENIAIQAIATTDVLTYLGFTHPLDSERYSGVVEYIDIHLTALKGNGLAYENPSIYNLQAIKEGKCALNLYIRNNLEAFPVANWTTVTHEIFHLYQYGYNQFKDGWYHEGMANWADRILKVEPQGGSSSTLLPATQDELDNNIYKVDYNYLWHRLAFLSDSTDGQLNIPTEILNRTYIDGTRVFKDEKLRGYSFIKKVLENFKVKSDQLSIQNNWHPHRWSESNQTNPANRTILLDAIQETMLQFGMNKTDEQREFLNLN